MFLYINICSSLSGNDITTFTFQDPHFGRFMWNTNVNTLLLTKKLSKSVQNFLLKHGTDTCAHTSQSHTHKDTRGLHAAVGLHKAQPVKLGTASWTQHTHYSLSKTKLYPPHSAPYHPYTNYRMPSRQLSAWVAESGQEGDWDKKE